MNRYFVAVTPTGLNKNPTLKQLLGKMKRTLEEREYEVRWVRPELWHVTLAFLGELSNVQIAQLKSLIQDWRPNLEDLTLRLQGFGGFPSGEQARVLWIGVQESQQFLDLQADLISRLRGTGLPTGGESEEGREFRPHVTLARLRNAQSLTSIIELGGRKHFGDYKISDIIVLESVLEGNVVKYIPRFSSKGLVSGS
jgi:RNA 2',3'-cyclic 3'-phosphodiesterase